SPAGIQAERCCRDQFGQGWFEPSLLGHIRRGSGRERVSMLAGNERRNEGAPAQSINPAMASHSDRGGRAHYTPQRPSLPQPLTGKVMPLPASAFARVAVPQLRLMY